MYPKASARHAIEILNRLISVLGASGYLRSDNGPKFASRTSLNWLAAVNIDTAYIDPGKS